MGSSNKRVPPYLVLVLLAIGAAALSVGILHKMRERRVLTVLLQERDQQLISLQVLLEVWTCMKIVSVRVPFVGTLLADCDWYF